VQAAIENHQVEPLTRRCSKHKTPARGQRDIQSGNRMSWQQGLEQHGVILSGCEANRRWFTAAVATQQIPRID
jgi:hypothetical protein